MSKVRYKCPSCGSTDVSRDAFAEWNEETQQWELSNIYDNFICNDCGHEPNALDEEEIEA